ncbi:GlxA family transcriptional regulator [Timonella sp. A28]|uniref:GlxA family transcriptional regulator n=1 Tax=Timonella sp. A28 TaxID=3442640 RepID=UPI003EC09513
MNTAPSVLTDNTTRTPHAVRVVFVIAPHVHLLDLAGPAQVFSAVSEHSTQTWELSYVSSAPSVTSFQGLPLHVETRWPALAPEDIIVIPGWHVCSTNTIGHIPRDVLEHLIHHHGRGGTIMSVCAGAFALAEIGLLDGRKATTHHDLQHRLAVLYPHVQVVPDVLYVNDGNIHTSAGIASGIDLSLHLVAQRLGPQTASRIARAMVIYARRNGHEPQDSVMLQHRDHVDDLVHRIQDFIEENYTQKLPLTVLADHGKVSTRTLTRAFARSIHMTPLRYQHMIRYEHAQRLITSGATREIAARTVGFDDARMLRTLHNRTTRA